jgi:tetratricopeptide (TPR) repeat protein
MGILLDPALSRLLPAVRQTLPVLQTKRRRGMNNSQDRWADFVAELRRRHVVRVGLGYAGAAFVLLQVAQLLFEALLLPERTFQLLVILAIVGFPVALLLGWVFDLTPEGLRITGSAGEAGRLVARLRPRYALGLGGVLLLGGLSVVVLAHLPRTASAELAPGTDLIAVLPFTSSGDGVKVLEQGMVDLLSRNLNEVGGVRTVDPRLVLSRWERRAAGAQLAFEDALAVALEAHASSFLTGSVVSVGSSVRISADLYSIEGTRLAGVQVDGSAQELLGLVDSLSLALLREIWRSSAPVPRLNVAAITSGDLDAIRAFLAGERFYRAAVWDSAMAAFQRAVAADSLFALAHYRLATTAGWLGAEEVGARGAATALRLRDRLPSREQTLITVEALRHAGQLAEAIDSLSAYVEQYPDDPEAWFFLADALFHMGQERAALTDFELESTLWMFERAVALDPGFTPALIHPLELAFGSGDLAVIEPYVQLLLAAPSIDSVAAGVYRAAYRAFQHPEDAALVRAALQRVASASAGGGMYLVAPQGSALVGSLLRLAVSLPAPQRADILSMLQAELAKPGQHGAVAPVLYRLLAMEGRLEEARQVLSEAARQRQVGRDVGRWLGALPVFAGYADLGFFPEQADIAPTAAARYAAELVVRVDRADAPGLRGLLSLPSPVEDVELGAYLVRAGAGFLRVLEGDTAYGLVELESVLRDRGFRSGLTSEAFWFRWLTLAITQPETRARALPILERPWPGDPLYEVPRYYLLAQALERDGQPERAREAYDRFSNALSGADGGLLVQARRNASRSALQRLRTTSARRGPPPTASAELLWPYLAGAGPLPQREPA